MNLRVEFRPAAAADTEEGFRWYEASRLGLGDEFLAEVERIVRTIAQHPERYPVVYRHLRRALLSRFPYGIFFECRDDRIVIVACFHAKRNPQIWQAR